MDPSHEAPQRQRGEGHGRQWDASPVHRAGKLGQSGPRPPREGLSAVEGDWLECGEVRDLVREIESPKHLCRERENALTGRKKQDIRTNHPADVGDEGFLGNRLTRWVLFFSLQAIGT